MNITVQGIGAVSPAGWGVEKLREVLETNTPLPATELARPGWTGGLRVRAVPPPQTRPAIFAQPRLRRASPISQYAVAAAMEALGSSVEKINRGEVRLGIIFCVMSGCVNYSRRFYDETLRDPATASPLVFPETVFNAPASHLASLLGSRGRCYTMVGDPGTFLQGLALAAQWLGEKQVDGCLVVGAEELDWLTADASRLFCRDSVLSAGAGAVYLTESSSAEGPVLSAVTDAHLFLRNQSPACAAAKMRAQLPSLAEPSLLCDGLQQVARADRDELRAWDHWQGARLSPKAILGEGFAAASAWQCVAALDALKTRAFQGANVSVVGCNQQAIGAQFLAKPAL